jgi:ACT domain-containing protein
MALSETDIQKIIDLVSGQVKDRDLPPKVLRQVILQVVDRLEGRIAPQPITSQPITPELKSTGLYDSIENTNSSRVIISAFGKDRPGVVAAIAKTLADGNITIQDIQQNIMQEFFGMIMIADISGATISFDDLKSSLDEIESSLGCKILTQHEDIFRFMHRI